MDLGSLHCYEMRLINLLHKLFKDSKKHRFQKAL